jgi:hypothetical protein
MPRSFVAFGIALEGHKSKMIKNIIIVIVSVILSIFILEGALWVGKFRPVYTGISAVDSLSPALWWVCDDTGCRFDKNHIADYYFIAKRINLSKKSFYKRLRIVNSQGFHDESEFVYSQELGDAFRILVLGDSFTWGASADLGCSWVEIVRKDLGRYGKVAVWNAAIPATGTKQALETLRHLASIMKPHLVLLGFCVNDFADNLYPLDQYFRRVDGLAIVQYNLDLDFNPIKLSPREAYRRALGSEPSQFVSPMCNFLGKFRVGTLLWEGTSKILAMINKSNDQDDGITGIGKDNIKAIVWERERSVTENLLRELLNYNRANKSDLLVLLVPEKSDLVTISKEYLAAREIMRTLNIEFVDPLTHLNLIDYDDAYPDFHWENSGHTKAAEMIMPHIISLIKKERTVQIPDGEHRQPLLP